MSQKLSGLVRSHVGTAEGARFVEKYFSPAAIIDAERVPDEFGGSSALSHSQRTLSLTASTYAGGKVRNGWKATFVTTPIAGAPVQCRFDYVVDGTGAAGSHTTFITEGNALLKQALAENNSGTKYRVTAKSITAHLDANATSNQGTVYAATIGNSYRGAIGTGADTTIDLSRSSFWWKGANLEALSDPSLISTMPGAVTWDATDGIYAINHNDGGFQWARADLAYVQFISGGGTVNSWNINAPMWEPCLDWDVNCVVFDNLHADAKIVLKVITDYEIIPEVGSIYQGETHKSATDMSTLALIKGANDQFGHFYPADFNDWGTLWQSTKDFFGKAKPLLSKAANYIPGVGPVVSKVIDAIPVQSAASREAATRKLAEQAERAAMLENAAVKQAEAILKNKSNVKPSSAPYQGKAWTSPQGRAKCAICSKLFKDPAAVQRHVQAKHSSSKGSAAYFKNYSG